METGEQAATSLPICTLHGSAEDWFRRYVCVVGLINRNDF